MKDYTSNTPVFSDKICILEVTDTGHADNANCPVKQLLQNTLILKNIIDAVTENLSGAGLMGNEEGTPNRLDAHIGDNEVHVTAEEKAGLEEVKENITEINSAMDQLKKSVADGKALIASAITSKGVSTASGAEFGTMANNIKGISTTPIVSNYSTSPGDASFNRTLFTADKYGYVSIYTYAYTGSGSATCRVRINGTIQSNGVHAISAGSVVSVEGTNNGSYTRTMYSVVYVRV